jgi:MFS family permease
MPQRSIGYLQLLRENHDFTRLWVGQLVSGLGDWFNTVAVLALVFDLTHSGLATGLIIIASTLPAFLLTPFAGVIADRFDRRRVTMTADLVRAFLALGMLLVRSPDQIWMLYLFSALLVTFSSFFNPALNAAIPNLVSRESLVSANALSSTTWGLMLAVGAAVGGITIALVGRDMSFIINSLSFLFSASMIFSIRRRFGHGASHPHSGKGGTWQEFRASLAFTRQHPPVMMSVLVKTGIGLAAGILLLLTIFAQGIFRAGDSGIGWFYSARGLGALLGPYLARPFVGQDVGKMRQVVLLSFFVAGAGYFAFSGAPLFWIAALCVVLAHTGTGAMWTLSSTMLQLLVPDHYRGRIFAIDFGLNTVTGALSTFLVGVAVEQWDARVVATAMGVVFVVYAIVWGAAVLVSRLRNPAAWTAALAVSLEHEPAWSDAAAARGSLEEQGRTMP